jgi:cyclophilin family peptidyl-prolyl cis-trans isomerase
MEHSRSSYPEHLQDILETPLSPANVNTYAFDALNGVTELVGSAREDFVSTNYGPFMNDSHAEDCAMTFHGLDDVNNILDYLNMKQSEIERIGRFILSIPSLEEIIVHPDKLAAPETGSGNGWKEKDIMPRLQTILFLLKNEFGQDIYNPQEVKTTAGIVTGDMMRKTSYCMIELAKLDKTILVCDEEGNVTYVFDQTKLTKAGISPEDLTSFTKKELNDIIDTLPKTGVRIVYSEDIYTGKINEALYGNLASAAQKDSKTTKQPKPSYLDLPVPHADEYGALSFVGTGKLLGMGPNTVEKLALDLGIQTGDFKFGEGNVVTKGFMSEELTKLKQTDEFLTPDADEYGALSKRGTLRKLGFDIKTVERLIKELGIQTGDFKFGARIAKGFMSEELTKLKQTDEFLTPDADEYGATSFNGGGRSLGMDIKTVERLIKELGIQTGDFKFGSGKIAKGFMPEELTKLKQTYECLTPDADEYGAMSFYGAGRSLGMDIKTVERLIKELGIQTGDFKFGARIAKGFMSEELTKLKQTYECLTPDADEYGAMSFIEAGRSLGVATTTVERLIKELGIQTGDFKFRSKVTKGFMPEELTKLNQTYECLTPDADEYGAMSFYGAGRSLGMDIKTVERLIKELGIQTGDFKFRSGKIAKGFMRREIDKIKAYRDSTLYS